MKPFLCFVVAFSALIPQAFAAPQASMRDVPPGFWASAAVHHVVGSGLMKTDSSGKFNGNAPVTRYQLAVILDRLVHQMQLAHKPLSSLPHQAVTIPHGTPIAAAHALKHLVGAGFLPKATVLLARPGTQPVTAIQLVSALKDVTIGLSSCEIPPDKNK